MRRERPRVVIVGGGFGGLTAAQALDGAAVDVTLVDKTNYHLFQPLLYQVAIAGLSPAEIASPIRGILAGQSNARVLLGEVSGVDVDGHCVELATGDVLDYDYLVLAAGARTSYFGHDDWEKSAPSLKTLEDALEIRRRVLLAFERAEAIDDPRERSRLLTFVVIGGGPTGIELAGSIAELSRFVLAQDFRSIDPREAKVVLLEAGPRILASYPESLAGRAIEQLAELGVEVRTGSRVTAIDEHGVELIGDSADDVPGLGAGRGAERVFADTVVWGAGVRAAPLGAALGVPLDRSGRVQVEPDTSLPGHPEVFCIGDMAYLEQDGASLPGVSPVAMQQARHVAKIISREASRGVDARPERKPFRYFDKGTMATIGRSRAIAEARGIHMSGFLAWLAWLFVHIWYLIGFRNRFVVLFTWAWSYFSYRRGARLITATGWAPTDEREPSAEPVPSRREGARSRSRARPPPRAATPA
jgi:NADH:ubiquinone reductase (H+-translocating)